MSVTTLIQEAWLMKINGICSMYLKNFQTHLNNPQNLMHSLLNSINWNICMFELTDFFPLSFKVPQDDFWHYINLTDYCICRALLYFKLQPPVFNWDFCFFLLNVKPHPHPCPSAKDGILAYFVPWCSCKQSSNKISL